MMEMIGIFKNKFLVSAVVFSVLTLGLTPSPVFADEPQAAKAIIEAKPVIALIDQKTETKSTPEKQIPSSNDFLMSSAPLIKASQERTAAGPASPSRSITSRFVDSMAAPAGVKVQPSVQPQKSPVGSPRKLGPDDNKPREYSLTGNLRELTGPNTLQRTAFEFTAINAAGQKQSFIIDGRSSEDIADKLRHAIEVNGGQNIEMRFVEAGTLEGVKLHNTLAIEKVTEKKYPSDYFTFDELLGFRATFGLKNGEKGYNDRFDFTGDGIVGIDDFGFFRKHYKGDTKPREYSLTGNLRELTGPSTLQLTAFEFTAIDAAGMKKVFIIDGRNAEDIADKLRHAIIVNGGQNIAMKFVESMIFQGVQIHNVLAIENVAEKKYPAGYFSEKDFVAFKATFGLKNGDKGYNDRFDFTGDGIVGVEDFGFFRRHYKGDTKPREYSLTGNLRELTGPSTLQRTAFEFTAVDANGQKKVFIIDGRNAEDIADKLRHAIIVNGGQNIAMKFIESMILEGVQLHNALAIENVAEKKYPAGYFSEKDFAAFKATFGLKNGDKGYNDRFDFTGDGIVGVEDFGFFRKHYKGDTTPREYSLTGNLRELTGPSTLQRTAFEFTAINAAGQKQVFIIDGRSSKDIADKLRHAIEVNGGQNIEMRFVEAGTLEGVKLHNTLAIEKVTEKKYPSDYFTFDELLGFRATFGLKNGDKGYNDRFDFTGDGIVGIDDFGFFRKHYKGDTK
ncbi:MAG: hypothetical protein KBC91_04615, partial [Candidatus Omnitrophica bacterium]|nr:hypothetical protein [Candidatus Omnitrophota bacterium]